MDRKALEGIRKDIDAGDARIVELLAARMELVLSTSPFKEGVVDPGREAEVLEHVSRVAGERFSPGFTEELFTLIIREARARQETARGIRGM